MRALVGRDGERVADLARWPDLVRGALYAHKFAGREPFAEQHLRGLPGWGAWRGVDATTPRRSGLEFHGFAAAKQKLRLSKTPGRGGVPPELLASWGGAGRLDCVSLVCRAERGLPCRSHWWLVGVGPACRPEDSSVLPTGAPSAFCGTVFKVSVRLDGRGQKHAEDHRAPVWVYAGEDRA